MKIAVLLTTYNRKQKTIACLKTLRMQTFPVNIEVEIFLTDDASSDGTAEAVKIFFPEVHLYYGNGSLFWAGGMRSTWQHALKSNADYFLLLNDDTLLYKDALSSLIKSIDMSSKPAICIGSTVDINTGNISYGGSRLRYSKRWSGYTIHSKTSYLSCDFGNANIMLVPRKIVDAIGILNNGYTHSLADYDYTLTAKKAGFEVIVAPGFLGSCTDDHGNNWMGQKTSFKQRLKYLKSPKGLTYKEYLYFIRNHFPLSYPTAFCKLWLKTFFPFLWETFKNNH